MTDVEDEDLEKGDEVLSACIAGGTLGGETTGEGIEGLEKVDEEFCCGDKDEG